VTRRLRSLAVLALVGLAGCASDPYGRYPDSLYASLKDDTREARSAHAALLERVIAWSDEQGRPPPPGVCAELAYYRTRLGQRDQAEALLAREEASYPESARFLTMVRKVLADPGLGGWE
jgi:hypothetical protein